MNEEVRELNVDPPLLEPAPEIELTPPVRDVTTRGWLRIAYTVEFFIAILTIFTLWSEIGGQGHLDLIPWYVKLICVLGSSWCSVRFTAGIAEQRQVWNRRSIRWLAGIVFFAIAMGSITYYYHLHEEPDDDSDDATGTVSVAPSSPFYYRSDRTRS